MSRFNVSRTGWRRMTTRGYDTFDGLNANSCARLLSITNFYAWSCNKECVDFLSICALCLGVAKSRSTKGMGFMARGFLRLHEATGDPTWREKAELALQWLVENQSPGYCGRVLG